jgi:hypothetical protein
MTRARWVGLVALLLALGGALGTGFYSYAKLTPAGPQHTLTIGESVEVHGVRYRLDSFTEAESLPGEKDDDPPVRGPAGSLIVLIVISQTIVDRTVRLDEHFCDATLVADLGAGPATVWKPESDVTFALRRPAALGCGDTSDNPLSYGVERPMGFSFVIPAAAAGAVSGRLSTDDDSVVIAFRP